MSSNGDKVTINLRDDELFQFNISVRAGFMAEILKLKKLLYEIKFFSKNLVRQT